MYLCVYNIGSTYPKHEIEEHEQCFHAGHCGHSLQSFAHLCLLLTVFSEMTAALRRMRTTLTLAAHSRLPAVER